MKKYIFLPLMAFIFTLLTINCGGRTDNQEKQIQESSPFNREENTEQNIKEKPESPANFCLPYPYGKRVSDFEKEYTTVFLDSKKKIFIITDSTDVIINGKNKIRMYFLTPYSGEVNTQCPDEFGMVVLNDKAKEIYRNFDLGGNFYDGVDQFKIGGLERNLLAIGSSGCGSGVSITRFDVFMENNKFTLKEAFSKESGGYSTVEFRPKQNYYMEIERLNPECHYSCPSKYGISYYRLSDDDFIGQTETRNEYDDFNDIGTDELLKQIKKKERGVLLK